MATRLASRLESFFRDRVGDDLRSIVRYEQHDFDVEFVRDDVEARYTEDELEAAVDESRMESLSAPIYTDAFAEDHGELTCLTACFEHTIEMNFILDDGVGVAVGLDVEAMEGTHGLVADAREVVVEGRERFEAADA